MLRVGVKVNILIRSPDTVRHWVYLNEKTMLAKYPNQLSSGGIFNGDCNWWSRDLSDLKFTEILFFEKGQLLRSVKKQDYF